MKEKLWSDDDWRKAVEEFIAKVGSRVRITAEETTLMFNLHNDRVPEYWTNRKTGTSCGSCVKTVWERLNQKIQKLKESDAAKPTE